MFSTGITEERLIAFAQCNCFISTTALNFFFFFGKDLMQST